LDIKNLPVGITKLKKGGKGTVILGCESESEMKQLKVTMREKLGKDFVEPKKIKPKLKVINIEEEEMILKDEKLIDTIKKQNNMDGNEESYIRVVKRFRERRGGISKPEEKKA